MADGRHAEQVADLLKAVGQESRLAILEALRQGETCVSDLSRATGRGQSNLSKHLAFLRRTGVIAATRRGLRVFYRIVGPEVPALMDAAQAVLARARSTEGARAPEWPHRA